MPLELTIPEMGESITTVQIGRWHKKPGDRVEADETLVEIETDKVTQELPAPVAGTLGDIQLKQGDEASIGDVLGVINEGEGDGGGDGGGDGQPKPQATTDERHKSKAQGNGESKPEATPSDRGKSAPQAKQRDSEQYVEKDRPPASGDEPRTPHTMPSAARLMAKKGLAQGDIQPTGPGNRILKEDVQTATKTQSPPHADAERGSASEASGSARESEAGDREELIPMSPLRRAVARRLVEAQQTGALLTTYNEVDMSAVMSLRKQYQDDFVKKYSIKLGFMSFFVKAAVDALKQFPAVNAEVRGTDILYKNHYDIGIAVGTGKGLVVPVLRDADALSFAQVEQSINDFAKRAQGNQLKLDELQGGTFTITNGGVFGSLLSTPIVNPPQSAILGMHAIQPRPIALNNEVVIRPMMYLALTYDHRLVDGREAVTFLVRIKQSIEDPTRMLMEV